MDGPIVREVLPEKPKSGFSNQFLLIHCVGHLGIVSSGAPEVCSCSVMSDGLVSVMLFLQILEDRNLLGRTPRLGLYFWWTHSVAWAYGLWKSVDPVTLREPQWGPPWNWSAAKKHKKKNQVRIKFIVPRDPLLYDDFYSRGTFSERHGFDNNSFHMSHCLNDNGSLCQRRCSALTSQYPTSGVLFTQTIMTLLWLLLEFIGRRRPSLA